MAVDAEGPSVEKGRRPPSGSGEDNELRRGVLPLWAIFGVALGVLAPSTTLALAIGVVAATSGSLSWLTWLLTSLVVVGFAGAIAWLASRHTTTGGLYGLAAKVSGPGGGYLVLVTQLSAVLLGGPACALGSALYFDAWLVRIGAPHGTPILVAACVVVVVLNAVMCSREIKLAAKVLLAIEFLTVGVIVVLLAVVLVKAPGGPIDHTQFQLHDVKLGAILAAAGFSVFSMSGFENAANLGREARNPTRAIGIAMVGSIVTIGVLYVVASYVIVLGFHGRTFEGSSAPLDTLASDNGVGWLGYLIDLGVGVSFFGSSLGIMAGTSRTLYTLARDAVLPRAFARVHRTRRTPTTAVAVLAVIYLVLSVGGVLVTSAEHSYGLLGTLAGYLLVAAYGIATVVAGAYAVRTRSLGVGVVTAVLLGVAGVVLVYWFSFRPFPSGAFGIVAWIFIGVVVASVLTCVGLRTLAPRLLGRVGRSEANL
ncbi:MAG: hypothetical protein QOG76_4194 [Pseudonocardiales bacterium]|nr:hypothetical protein [Pseudonocardiales bacterium]